MKNHSSFKLDKKVKKAWLKALRSGKYKQGRGRIYSKHGDNYCCLGVARAEKLCRARPGQKDTYVTDKFLPNNIQTELASMNDTGNNSFSDIANWIEENL